MKIGMEEYQLSPVMYKRPDPDQSPKRMGVGVGVSVDVGKIV